MSIAKPLVFYFNFVFEDEDEVNSDDNVASEDYGFVLSADGVEKLYSAFNKDVEENITAIIYENIADSNDNFVEKMERKYGIHDWSSSPNDAVVAIGYTSYEVPREKVLPLMNEWRNYFEKYAPGETTQIVKFDAKLDSDDLKCYYEILANVAKLKSSKVKI